jgi:putative Mg2+ transporter-C (MgtC) family protein
MIELHDWPAMLARLAVAAAIGLALGFEREWRGHDAGMRTHALVALSSAMITVSSLLLFNQLKQQGGASDPLRVIQGLAQAIGFIAGGLIFIRGRDVKNMTTAASLWMAAAVGIGAGAGQYWLIAIATLIALVLLTIDRALRRFIPAKDGQNEKRTVTMPSRRGASHSDDRT